MAFTTQPSGEWNSAEKGISQRSFSLRRKGEKREKKRKKKEREERDIYILNLLRKAHQWEEKEGGQGGFPIFPRGKDTSRREIKKRKKEGRGRPFCRSFFSKVPRPKGGGGEGGRGGVVASQRPD